jgi:hypothetical protein
MKVSSRKSSEKPGETGGRARIGRKNLFFNGLAGR